MKYITLLLSGIIFGVGLILSGMTNPLKVQNFLDLFGIWDPSLAFVMGGAIFVALPGFWLVQKQKKPIFNESFDLPKSKDLDFRLIFGAGVFGIEMFVTQDDEIVINEIAPRVHNSGHHTLQSSKTSNLNNIYVQF